MASTAYHLQTANCSQSPNHVLRSWAHNERRKLKKNISLNSLEIPTKIQKFPGIFSKKISTKIFWNSLWPWS